MPRYWVIAPVESKPPELFDKVWHFDVANNLLSIGWEELGDVSQMSREQLANTVAATFPEKPQQTKGLICNMIWAVYHEIVPGDLIVARRGRKILAAVGKVTVGATYSPRKNPAHGHPHYLQVSWQDSPRDKAFSSVVFPMHTVAEISEQQFQSYLGNVPPQVAPTEPPPVVEDQNEFVLEKYLEDFIVSNFGTIFKGELKIFEAAEINEGQQYPTDIGPIDILAVEPKTNSFVVIELKKGRPSDQVIGQILRYMGWVKKMLCTNGQSVRGLIICRDPDQKLSFALEMTNNIDVRYYSVSFKLKESP
jgi:restriction system protein